MDILFPTLPMSKTSVPVRNMYFNYCFSKIDSNCVTMGFAASQSKLRGPLYLTTRDSSPFCGKCCCIL